MSGIPGIPQQFNVQTGNGQNLVSWSQSAGATSYLIQQSLDNVTYTNLVTISGSPLATSYLDSAVTLGTNYFYQVAAINASGQSSFTIPQAVVPTTTGEMSLSQIRLASQQKADRVNSNFVTLKEWNDYINRAMFELYDLLVAVYEDYYMATPIQFVCDGNTYLFPLPNGTNQFLNALTLQPFTPQPIYKLQGVDLALNNATNAYVTVNKFQFIDRNRFVYPNTASTLYGVFNLQYRMVGNNIEFIPTPTGGQSIRLWYIPRMTRLLQETDITSTGISGWNEYIIVRAAKYALDKEESDTTKLDQELIFLKGRIEESAANRDNGQPDRISDTRSNQGSGYGGSGGFNGGTAGWALLAIPKLISNNETYRSLTNTKLPAEFILTYGLCFVAMAYLFYLLFRKFGTSIRLSNVSSPIRMGHSSLRNSVSHIVKLSALKQVVRINTKWIVTLMANVKSLCNRAIINLKRPSSAYSVFTRMVNAWTPFAVKSASPIPAFGNNVDFNSTKKSIQVHIKTVLSLNKEVK